MREIKFRVYANIDYTIKMVYLAEVDCQALGWKRLITYILSSESGTSLYAANWKLIGEAGGGSWNVKSRPRVDKHPTQKKLLFEAA